MIRQRAGAPVDILRGRDRALCDAVDDAVGLLRQSDKARDGLQAIEVELRNVEREQGD